MQFHLPILTRCSFVISITWPILVTPAARKATSNELKSAKERNCTILSSLDGSAVLILFIQLMRPGHDFRVVLHVYEATRWRAKVTKRKFPLFLPIQKIQMLFQCKEQNVLTKTICFHLFLVYKNHSKRVKFRRTKKTHGLNQRLHNTKSQAQSSNIRSITFYFATNAGREFVL